MPSPTSRRTIGLITGFALSWCTPAVAQVANLADGPMEVVVKFDLPLRMLPARSPSSTTTESGDAPPATIGAPSAGPATGLAFYTANYLSLRGKELPFRIVGTDPSLGANTTTIPTVLVPLKFIFPNPENPVLDGTTIVAATGNSPIFQAAGYTAGPVDLGVTQYGDALQRAEFWNLPGFSPDYHVLLETPSVAETVTVSVPSGKGNAFALSGGGFMGVVDTTFFFQVLGGLLESYSANQLPIFVTDNVFLGANGLMQNCCIFGFHASQGAPVAAAKTWIYAAYIEAGTFSPPGSPGEGLLDVLPLSHEVAEWLNDPFVGASSGINFVPPAVLSGGACIPNFETGDPLEGPPFAFTRTIDSTVYHLQDEVLLPWYLHTVPSFSVNGQYTFQDLSATIPLVINAPESIAGTYTNTAPLTFAPVDMPVTAEIAYVGTGCPDDVYLDDPSGKIALIDRGTCNVSLKIDRAVQAGATGVLIGLVAPGDPISFSYGGGSNFAPSLVITQAASNLIKSALGEMSIVNATISPDNAIPPPFSTLCGPG